MLTPEDIAAIRERAEKATAGRWWAVANDSGMIRTDSQKQASICQVNVSRDEYHDNIGFIAHSRQDIPALLSHIEELQERSALHSANHKQALTVIQELEAKLARAEKNQMPPRGPMTEFTPC